MEFMLELFLADIAILLFLDGKLKAGEAIFVDMVDVPDSFLVVQGLAPLSPH